jgi:hypothetical protein
LSVGAAKATDPPVSRDVTITFVGAPGTVAGTKLFETAEGSPVPTAFVAVTVHV